MYKNKQVLVTGGTGMIGIQLVRLLLDQGANVRVASLDPLPSNNNDIEFIRGNLVDWEFCQKITSNMDYVFQLAGIKGSVGIGTMKAASFFVPHILMNTMMMEAARKADVQRYLYTSSVGVYHPASLFVEDEAWDGPPHHTDRFAGWAKRMGELQAEAYKTEYGWDQIAIVRPSNVYGPKDNFDPQTAMVIPALINRVAAGENPLVVWGDGSAIRDFIYSKDVAEGMLLAMEHGANCTPINLGSGEGVSIRSTITLPFFAAWIRYWLPPEGDVNIAPTLDSASEYIVSHMSSGINKFSSSCQAPNFSSYSCRVLLISSSILRTLRCISSCLSTAFMYSVSNRIDCLLRRSLSFSRSVNSDNRLFSNSMRKSLNSWLLIPSGRLYHISTSSSLK